MSAHILNFGSINIDHTYRLHHFPQPGETTASLGYRRGAGGKGLNQSIALARAGGKVRHLGAVGPEGGWLKELLRAEGVDERNVLVGTEPTGHAVIQVDDAGQNTIVLFAGANQSLPPEQIVETIARTPARDWFLCQNETNGVDLALRAARAAALTVCFNPAPITPDTHELPLEAVDFLFVNEIEGAALSGGHVQPAAMLDALLGRWPHLTVVLTLGERGAIHASSSGRTVMPAPNVRAIDTTAAGDTFIGYFIASMIEASDPHRALHRACQAAALSTTRPGAMDSIPRRNELAAHAG